MAFLKHQTSTDTFLDLYPVWRQIFLAQNPIERGSCFLQQEKIAQRKTSIPVPIYLRPPVSTYSGLLRIMSTLSVSYTLAPQIEQFRLVF